VYPKTQLNGGTLLAVPVPKFLPKVNRQFSQIKIQIFVQNAQSQKAVSLG